MKSYCSVVIAAFLSFGGTVFATGVDPADSVLVAYKLTADQSAQFSATDSVVSPFWSLIAESDHDYWKLLPSTSAYLQGAATGFAGDSDAQTVMKAAYDTNGMYFYFRIIDDSWTADTGWQPDKVDLYIDKHPSSYLNVLDSLTAIDGITRYATGKITQTAQQLWIGMGDSLPLTGFQMNAWDSNSQTFLNTTVDLAAAPKKMKRVVIDPNTRVLEMFIPWTSYGVGGVDTSVPAPMGTLYAISGGYNDLDTGSTAPDCLRILHNGDPYLADANHWADVELGPMIADFTVRTVNSLHAHATVAGRIVKTEYFTFTGRKVVSPAAGSCKLLVRRDIMANGKAVRSIVRY
jgi:hypothetical protein